MLPRTKSVSPRFSHLLLFRLECCRRCCRRRRLYSTHHLYDLTSHESWQCAMRESKLVKHETSSWEKQNDIMLDVGEIMHVLLRCYFSCIGFCCETRPGYVSWGLDWIHHVIELWTCAQILHLCCSLFNPQLALGSRFVCLPNYFLTAL